MLQLLGRAEQMAERGRAEVKMEDEGGEMSPPCGRER